MGLPGPVGPQGATGPAASGALDLGASGSIKTGAPSGDTAAVWKLGSFTAASVSVDNTGYVTVEIGGVVYKLALAI